MNAGRQFEEEAVLKNMLPVSVLMYQAVLKGVTVDQ